MVKISNGYYECKKDFSKFQKNSLYKITIGRSEQTEIFEFYDPYSGKLVDRVVFGRTYAQMADSRLSGYFEKIAELLPDEIKMENDSVYVCTRNFYANDLQPYLDGNRVAYRKKKLSIKKGSTIHVEKYDISRNCIDVLVNNKKKSP